MADEGNGAGVGEGVGCERVGPAGGGGVGTPGGTPERPALFFADAAEFRAWLEAHHESADELWMGLYKKHVAERGLTWADAVPEALCFGWIDSRAERLGEDAMRQRWTPRRPRSVWSNVNIALVERLTSEGRMRPAGVAAFERRSTERSGIYAFESPQELSDEYAARLAAHAVAAAFWDEATPSYRRLAAHWVMTAKKPETREKRLLTLLDDCAAGRLIPTQRSGVEPKWVQRAAAAARAAAGTAT